MINWQGPERPVERLLTPVYLDGPDPDEVFVYIRRRVEDGYMLPLANGYSFVCVESPGILPEGCILPEAYAASFDNRQVPYAPIDTRMFGHDVVHMMAYQLALRVTRFADVAQEAAHNARHRGEVIQFTNSVDVVSGVFINLTQRLSDFWPQATEAAAVELRNLAALSLPESSSQAAIDQLQGDLWSRLALDQYAADVQAAAAADFRA